MSIAPAPFVRPNLPPPDADAAEAVNDRVRAGDDAAVAYRAAVAKEREIARRGDVDRHAVVRDPIEQPLAVLVEEPIGRIELDLRRLHERELRIDRDQE